jgi:FkbH-like protein
MYAAGAAREAERRVMASTDEWLRRLSVRVEVEAFNGGNAARAVQLLNKTNQMNLSTRRLTANELTEWLQAGQRRLWTYRVSDRFGDSGLTGVASIDVTDGRATLVDFVLSCRVFGRQVEAAMLHHATEAAAELGGVPLIATILPTAKNAPCLQFLQASGMDQSGDHEFRWSSTEPYPLPATIELARLDTEAAA